MPITKHLCAICKHEYETRQEALKCENECLNESIGYTCDILQTLCEHCEDTGHVLRIYIDVNGKKELYEVTERPDHLVYSLVNECCLYLELKPSRDKLAREACEKRWGK